MVFAAEQRFHQQLTSILQKLAYNEQKMKTTKVENAKCNEAYFYKTNAHQQKQKYAYAFQYIPVKYTFYKGFLCKFVYLTHSAPGFQMTI
jgi:hypothetical protein